MRIVRRLALGVVLAVDGRPFLGDHARGEPHPDAEEMAHDRVEVHGAVRLAAVQVERDAGDRDLDQHERDENLAPPGQIEQTVEQEEYMWLCAFLRLTAGSPRRSGT